KARPSTGKGSFQRFIEVFQRLDPIAAYAMTLGKRRPVEARGIQGKHAFGIGSGIRRPYVTQLAIQDAVRTIRADDYRDIETLPGQCPECLRREHGAPITDNGDNFAARRCDSRPYRDWQGIAE